MNSHLPMPWMPLTVSLQDAVDADLQVLQEVPESWHLEYKAQINQDPKKIAKEVAAFANTFGGYIFYGIKEHEDGSRRAQHFLGIPDEQAPAAEVAIRNGVAQHLSPPPYFEICRIRGDGDCAPVGTSILAVTVPPALDAPIIHSSGVIYRRVADSSEPNPETDRLVIDGLVRRRGRGEDDVRDFIRSLPEQLTVLPIRPALCYSIVPSPYSPVPAADKSFETLSKIFRRHDPDLVEFDTVFPLGTRLIAQLVGPMPRRSLCISAEVDRASGRIRITLPLNSFPTSLRNEFAGSAGYRDDELNVFFSSNAIRGITHDHTFIDVNDIARTTLGVGARLAEITRLVAPHHTWYGQATLVGGYHASPWAVGTRFRDHVAANGLPLVNQSVVSSASSLMAMAELGGHETPFNIVPLALDALELLGIPAKVVEACILEWSTAGRESTIRRSHELLGRAQ